MYSLYGMWLESVLVTTVSDQRRYVVVCQQCDWADAAVTRQGALNKAKLHRAATSHLVILREP